MGAGLGREDVQRDVAVILRRLGVVQESVVVVAPPREPPPALHCHWCGAPLSTRAKACAGHVDVEREYQLLQAGQV